MRKNQIGMLIAAALCITASQAQSIVTTAPQAVASGNDGKNGQSGTACPFTLGPICFQPAVGAIYAKRTAGEDYRDLRFAAVLHDKSVSRLGWGVMVAPGEKFIDALGIGGVTKIFDLDGGQANLNFGLLAKRFTEPEKVRGGAYLMLSVQVGGNKP